LGRGHVRCRRGPRLGHDLHLWSGIRGWAEVGAHSNIAARGENACLVCHPQGMCEECHEQNGVTP